MPRRRKYPPVESDLIAARKAASAKADAVVESLRAAGPCMVSKEQAIAILDGIEADNVGNPEVLRSVATLRVLIEQDLVDPPPDQKPD